MKSNMGELRKDILGSIKGAAEAARERGGKSSTEESQIRAANADAANAATELKVRLAQATTERERMQQEINRLRKANEDQQKLQNKILQDALTKREETIAAKDAIIADKDERASKRQCLRDSREFMMDFARTLQATGSSLNNNPALAALMQNAMKMLTPGDQQTTARQTNAIEGSREALQLQEAKEKDENKDKE
jgi:hypothetical protein